jgi:hypothetical protein
MEQTPVAVRVINPNCRVRFVLVGSDIISANYKSIMKIGLDKRDFSDNWINQRQFLFLGQIHCISRFKNGKHLESATYNKIQI